MSASLTPTNCGACGAPLAPGARVCGRCNTPVAAASTANPGDTSFGAPPIGLGDLTDLDDFDLGFDLDTPGSDTEFGHVDPGASARAPAHLGSSALAPRDHDSTSLNAMGSGSSEAVPGRAAPRPPDPANQTSLGIPPAPQEPVSAPEVGKAPLQDDWLNDISAFLEDNLSDFDPTGHDFSKAHPNADALFEPARPTEGGAGRHDRGVWAQSADVAAVPASRAASAPAAVAAPPQTQMFSAIEGLVPEDRPAAVAEAASGLASVGDTWGAAGSAAPGQSAGAELELDFGSSGYDAVLPESSAPRAPAVPPARGTLSPPAPRHSPPRPRPEQAPPAEFPAEAQAFLRTRMPNLNIRTPGSQGERMEVERRPANSPRPAAPPPPPSPAGARASEPPPRTPPQRAPAPHEARPAADAVMAAGPAPAPSEPSRRGLALAAGAAVVLVVTVGFLLGLLLGDGGQPTPAEPAPPAETETSSDESS